MAGNAPGPTLTNRIQSLDFLRGSAILGILVANIAAFAGPTFAESTRTIGPDWLAATVQALVTGKFRSLLCILFGVGMYLHLAKRGFHPQAIKKYRRRYLVLLGFGAFHALFIWFGDILFYYALVAIVAVWMVRAPSKTLGVLASLALAVSLIMGAFIDLLDFLVPHSDGTLFPEELRVFQLGTYIDQVVLRAKIMLVGLVQTPVICFQILGLMLVGILIARSGFLADPHRDPKLQKTLLIVGAVGLVLNLLPLALSPTGEELNLTVELGVSHFLSVGYLALGTLFAHSGVARRLVKMVADVGQLALTNYILQSVVCTAVYYSWGGALFDRSDWLQNVMVVAGVWIVNFVFTGLWLTKYRIGPLEWLWRRLAEGRPITAKRSDDVPPTEPPPLSPSKIGPFPDPDGWHRD